MKNDTSNTTVSSNRRKKSMDALAKYKITMAEKKKALQQAAAEEESKSLQSAEDQQQGKDYSDIGASIRNNSKTVHISQLIKSHEKVRVMNMKAIRTLIQEAVESTVDKLTQKLDENDRKQLLEEAEEDFNERMKAFQAEKKTLEEQALTYQDQLKSAERLLQKEQVRSIESDQFTVSSSGLHEMEERFQRVVNTVARKQHIDDSLSDELKDIMSHLLDSEREKIAEQAKKSQSDHISLLEKKVKRLASSLEDTEKERDVARRHAESVSSDGGTGLRNVMSSGLDEGDPGKEHKLELLKEIFDQNMAMRQNLQERGIDLTRRKPAASAQAEAAKPPAEEGVVEEVSSETPAAEISADEQDSHEISEIVEDEIHPDDMVWEPGSTATFKEENTAVTKIAIRQVEPPPLIRKTSPNQADVLDDNREESLENPDDMPWEPSAPVASEKSDSPVTKIAVRQVEPPPLMRTEKTQSAAGEEELLENPDDMMWEPSTTASTEGAARAVQKIKIRTVEPPPLERQA